MEFHNLKPLPQTAARIARLEAEAKMKQIYIPSATNEYWDLIDEINKLETDLQIGLDVGISEGAGKRSFSQILVLLFVLTLHLARKPILSRT